MSKDPKIPTKFQRIRTCIVLLAGALFVTGIIILGCRIDVERAKAYGWFGLKIGFFVGLLLFVVQFLPNKEKYTKTVWRDRSSGQIIKETGWSYQGLSSPDQRGKTFKGCIVLMPIALPILGLITASLMNTSSLLFGVPVRYDDEVMATLAIRAPVETNRIAHPLGFSIIVPADWKTEILEKEIVASKTGTEYTGKFYARACDFISDKDSFREVFQGRPARIKWDTGKATKTPGGFFSGLVRLLTQEVRFKQNDHFFCLSFEATNFVGDRGPLRKEPIPLVNEYFASFRYVETQERKR